MNTPTRRTRAAFEDVRDELLELADALRLLSTRDSHSYIEGMAESAFAVCARSASSIAARLYDFIPEYEDGTETGGKG